MKKFVSQLVALICLSQLSLVTSQIVEELKTVIVTVKDFRGQSHSELLEKIDISSFLDREAQLNGVVQVLEKFTTESQSQLLKFLQFMQNNGHNQIKVVPLWITNKIIIRQTDSSLIAALKDRPDVSRVQDDPVFHLNNPLIQDYNNVSVDQANQNVQWGVAAIKANEVWQSGITGQNVVVGTIDTGVRYRHEALIKNFRTTYGWYDPENKTTRPVDDVGHGTHTTGIMIGNVKGIGVAPNAQWIACKGCSSKGCFGSILLECGQWQSCPTNPQGTKKNCSKAPQIVSNSWGTTGGENFYDDVILAWKKQGIIPIFAVGNTGPGCDTLGAPSDSFEVMGVGSTEQGDKLSSFSSVGPSRRGQGTKPDFCAPGSSIVSASNTGNSAYVTMSGSSMACPHVSGTVALMLSKNRKLTYDQVKEALIKSCEPVQVTGEVRSCGGVSDTKTPNNQVGYGRINALKSVR